MSRYKLTTVPSKLQFRLRLGFWLLCIVALWLWPPMFNWQWLMQTILSGILVLVAFRNLKTRIEAVHLTFDDVGQLSLLQQHQWQPYQICAGSVSCQWFCYLHLEPLENPLLNNGKQRIWVFCDSVDDNSYRRLCRVILRMRRS